MSPAARKRLAEIEKALDRQKKLRAEALKKKRKVEVRAHDNRIKVLEAEKAQILKLKSAPVKGAVKGAPVKGAVKGSTVKGATVKGAVKVLKSIKDKEKPKLVVKPKGVPDIYWHVKPSPATAAKLVRHYTALLKRPFLLKRAKAYYTYRLNLAKDVTKRVRPPKRLRAAASEMRQRAVLAKRQKDYAQAQRLTTQADKLEQEARSNEIEPVKWDAKVDEGYLRPKEGRGEVEKAGKDEGRGEVEKAGKDEEDGAAEESAESPESSASSGDSVGSPWYKNPLVWGLTLAGVVLVGVFARPKGLLKMNFRGPKSKGPSFSTFKLGRPAKPSKAA